MFKPTVEKVFWDFCRKSVKDSNIHEPRARELCEEIFLASHKDKVELALALLESVNSEYIGIDVAKSELRLLLVTGSLK
jgi:hypothetical protein